MLMLTQGSGAIDYEEVKWITSGSSPQKESGSWVLFYSMPQRGLLGSVPQEMSIQGVPAASA